MAEISLTKLPWYAQIGAFFVLAVAGIGCFYWYYEQPLAADIASRQVQLNALRADINKGQATARKLAEFRSEVAMLEGKLGNLRQVLPEEKDAADLLRRLQTLAVQSNLKIRRFTPQPTVTKQLHAEWPIVLELDGNFHNLATYFDHISKLSRIINVSGCDVRGKEKPDPNSTITAACVATTFVLLDKPGAGKKAAPAAAVKKAG